MDSKKLDGFISQIEELTSKPEKYLSLQKVEAERFKSLTKNLYDLTKERESRKNKTPDVLEKLIIKNLDEEQIWQQIELQNNSICNSLVSDVAHLLGKKDALKFPIKEKVKKKPRSDEGKIKLDEKPIIKEKTKARKNVQQPKGESSIVDDKFFKLYEMQKFLEKVEKGEENYGSNDEEIDYFQDDSSSLNDDDDDNAQLHYNDFFDQPEGEAAGESTKNKKVKFLLSDDENEKESNSEADEEGIGDEDSGNDAVNNSLSCDDADEEEEDVNDDEQNNLDEMESNNNGLEDEYSDNNSENSDEMKNEILEQPSTFEARQQRLKTRIQNLEEEALAEKPWQLKGEVTASNRPQNSLLEEYVEFDIASRPAPVLTETSTLRLEDVIIQRIKDKAWDDVVRKIKPVENDIEYKKKLVLDQEKSKLSLAQIYEQEYLKQLDNRNEGVVEKPEVEAPEHQEIRIMMNKLFSKLDALSNFHFTPKQVSTEVKIVSNLPAINMEEVAPVATSDAMLLAPEEVKSKSKGDLIGKSERTATDKKRERRQKKLKQKLKYKQMEAKAKLQLGKSNSKNSKDQKVSEKFLQKITKSSNVVQLDKSEGGKYVKSSNAFFSKLQDETKSMVKKKNLELSKSKPGKKFIQINSKKFKSR